ncbi:ABC-2 family transporter protein [Hathewaya proteolytica DSM 3090]|uniref:ABC-2 family transporter protein n=1 Tax=Hathewaya proteolytica DSM 3090 TaxID=1121331 RepID=A0A1M6RG84_9CLOT|nr:ABC transporter permease subunit [Hathewaya proteolytica]SHK31491.1 ABC-2 family transporter protein [Hathewaya proteolytica DSM 3090]
MFKLIGFYFKTFFKSPKNYINIVLVGCAIIGGCVMFNLRRAPYEGNFSRPPLTYTVECSDEKGEKLVKLQQEVESAFFQKEWTNYYGKAIEYYEYCYETRTGEDQGVGYKKEIERYEYLLQENVPYIDENTSTTSLVFLKNLLNEPIVLLMLIGVLLSSAQLFSSEVENKTYKLLYTQPMSKNKIFFSKLISIIFINFAIVISLILVCFIYQTIVKGLGSPKWLTGVALSAKDALAESTSYITLGKYVLCEMGFLAMMIIFTCCLGTMVSLIINNSAASLCGATVILGLLYVLFKNKPFDVIQKFNPCAYMDIDRIMSLSPMSGLDAMLQTNPMQLMRKGQMKSLVNLSLSSGIMILSASIVVLVCINLFIVNKKNIAK